MIKATNAVNPNEQSEAYKRMVAAVRLIDPKAGNYLNGREIKQLDSFTCLGNWPTNGIALASAFVWEESPQGYVYWEKLAITLRTTDGW
jgi:hypothetical protein